MACSFSSFDVSIHLSALEQVTEDPSFQTSSPVAADALQAAKQILRFCRDAENEEAINAFWRKLVTDLSEPFAASSGRRPLVRDKLWKTLWSVRSSSGFITRWIDFCERASALATPILYQHLVFRRLVRDKFEIGHQAPLADTQEMSYDEANVLTQVCSWVCCPPHIKED